MLKKLLKYDLEYMFKFLIIFYSLSLFFGILTRLLFSIENSFIANIIAQVCNGAAISMMFSILINNLMRMWVRFKQNLYGDESYLTHTLPISKTNLYLSKIITALITLFTSILVITLTIFIMYYSKENLEMIKNLLFSITDAPNFTLLSLIFILFLEIANVLQCGFTGLILGHRKNNSKIGFSVLFGFISNILSQVLVLIMILIVGIFNKDIMNLIFTNQMISIETIKIITYMSIFMYLIIISIGYFININLFKKGVNVD